MFELIAMAVLALAVQVALGIFAAELLFDLVGGRILAAATRETAADPDAETPRMAALRAEEDRLRERAEEERADRDRQAAFDRQMAELDAELETIRSREFDEADLFDFGTPDADPLNDPLSLESRMRAEFDCVGELTLDPEDVYGPDVDPAVQADAEALYEEEGRGTVRVTDPERAAALRKQYERGLITLAEYEDLLDELVA